MRFTLRRPGTTLAIVAFQTLGWIGDAGAIAELRSALFQRQGRYGQHAQGDEHSPDALLTHR